MHRSVTTIPTDPLPLVIVAVRGLEIESCDSTLYSLVAWHWSLEFLLLKVNLCACRRWLSSAREVGLVNGARVIPLHGTLGKIQSTCCVIDRESRKAQFIGRMGRGCTPVMEIEEGDVFTEAA